MTLTKHIIICLLLSLICAAGGFSHGTGSDHDHPKNDQGIETARIWLKLVDDRRYNVSWQTAAPVFKAAVTADQWEKSIAEVRKPLGALIERHLFHDKLTTTLPGMPDGEYLVLRFVTKYQHKQGSVETVTVMKDDNDTWRVAGYFIK